MPVLLLALLCWLSVVHSKPSTRSKQHKAKPSQPDSSATSDTLLQLNTDLLNTYNSNKDAMLHSMVQSGNAYVLIVDEKLRLYKHTLEEPVYTSTSHSTLSTQYKHINHLPLNVLVMLQPSIANADLYENTDQIIQLNKDNIQQLTQYAQTLQQLDIMQATAAFNSTQQHAAVHIYTTTQHLVNQMLKTNTITVNQLYMYCGSIRDSVDTLTYAAAESIATIIHTQMHELLYGSNAQLSTADFDKLYIVCNIGSHMAKSGDVHSTYFIRLFDLHLPQRHGVHVIFNEMDGMQNDGLDSLSLHILDGVVSQLMFNNPKHLHRDVMADAAQHIVDKLLPLPSYSAQVYGELYSVLPMLIGIAVFVFGYMYVQNAFVRIQQQRQLPDADRLKLQ